MRTGFSRFGRRGRGFRVLVSLVVVPALLACERGDRAEQPGVAAKHSSKPPASRATLAGTQPLANGQAWELGREYTYDVELKSRITFASSGNLFDFDFRGKAELVPVERSDHGVSILLKLKNCRFVSRVPGTQQQFDALTHQLERPYAFTLRDGLVTEAFIANDIDPLVAGVQRTLSASLQLARRAAPGDSWTAREYDTTGEYTAEYKAEGPSVWSKRKTSYLGLLLAKGQASAALNASPEVLRSDGRIVFDAKARPKSISLNDELALRGAQTPLRSSTAVTLTAAGERNSDDAALEWAGFRGRATRMAANEPYASRVPQSVLDDAKIEGRTFAQVASRLEQLARKEQRPSTASDAASAPHDEQSAQEDARLFTALGAIFRRQPESVGKALQKIRARSPARDVFVDALGSADSPEAQRALVSLARGESHELQLRTRALIALSRTGRPTSEATQALIALLDERSLGTQALYGVGSHCRRYREAGETETSTRLGELLVQRLKAATTELRVSEALRAISNSGFQPALTAVRPFLNDPRDQVRVDAVRALRWMDPAQTEALIVQKLAEEQAKAVRLAAIEMLETRPATKTLLAALTQATSTEDSHVRHRAVEVMVRWSPKHPELEDTLQRVAQLDPEQRIRDLAGATP